MYFLLTTLFSILCVITEQTLFNKFNQGVTDVTNYTIPGTTTQIRFGYNLISFIPANYFKNLSSLQQIHLQFNNIIDIADSAFSLVTTVMVISLHDNKLSVIREHMFSGLPNLLMLMLNQIEIYKIEENSFHGNTVLAMLLLRDNLLSSVPQCMFHPDQHPTNLAQFSLDTNPLQCDTRLCWLKQSEAAGWITVVNFPASPVCAGPPAFSGRTWDSISQHDLCNSSTPG